MKNIFLIFLSLTVIFSAGLSCKPRHNNEKDSSAKGLFGLGGFANDVTGKRSCPREPGFRDSGDQPTWVFHWTNNELAIQNPKQYLEEVVRAGILANAKPEKFGTGMAGNGLYVAVDPFQSIYYGKILIGISIRPHSTFPIQGEGLDTRDWYKQKCAGFLYVFSPGIKSLIEAKNNKDPRREPALVLWDLAPIQSEKIIAWQADSGNSPTIFDAATSTEIMHLMDIPNDERFDVLSKLIPFLNTAEGSEENVVRKILRGKAFDRLMKCTDKVLYLRFDYDFFSLPFIPKRVLAFRTSDQLDILSLWKICGKEIGIGNGTESNFEEIVNSIDFYLNKNISPQVQEFKAQNAGELGRLKQVVQYWTGAHTIESWKPVNQ